MAAFMIAGLAAGGIALDAFAASTAWADEYTDAISGLASPGFAEKVTALAALGRLGDSRAIPVLEAMADNQLYTRKADGRLVIGSGGRDITLTDAATGEALGPATSRDLTRINANNALRTAVGAAVGRLQIKDPDPAKRLAAAETMARSDSPDAIRLLRDALAGEKAEDVREALSRTLAKLSLSSADAGERMAAIRELSGRLTPEIRALVMPLTLTGADGTFAEPDPQIRAAAAELVGRIDGSVHVSWRRSTRCAPGSTAVRRGSPRQRSHVQAVRRR